ncbi:MAG TPA: DUF5317 domain-containing protein [Actinomycetes bacterium]|nr:DUF5317 domain-containing protein [Actinomycetes bacterium]
MLVLVGTVLAIASPAMFGGHLSRLGYIKLRFWSILVCALLAQILIIEIVPEGNHAVLVGVHLATYVIAGGFVAVNWRVPGLLIIAAGGACNGITIALNDGTLPASRAALKMAGIPLDPKDFVNSGVLEHPTLAWLGDIFAWPQPMPLANVFSIGDMLIVFGAFYGAHKIAGSRLVKTPWVPRGLEVPWADEATPARPSAAEVDSGVVVGASVATEATADQPEKEPDDADAGRHRRLTPLTSEAGHAG